METDVSYLLKIPPQRPAEPVYQYYYQSLQEVLAIHRREIEVGYNAYNACMDA